jgi:hypothetical protein
VPGQVRFHFLAPSAGKRHMIESGGYLRKALFVRARLAQVQNALFSRIQPVSKTSKLWPWALGETYYVTIEYLEVFHEITGSAQVDVVETNRGHMNSAGLSCLHLEIDKSVIPLHHCFSAI